VQRQTESRPDNDVASPSTSRSLSVGRGVLLVGSVLFGVFYLMLAAGGASFVNECDNIVCAQLEQAIFAAIGGVALFVAAYQVLEGRASAAKVAFFGTLPILIVHVMLVLEDPNEAIFFPLSTTPPPVVSGVALLRRRRKR
jgi:hypothetical protein